MFRLRGQLKLSQFSLAISKMSKAKRKMTLDKIDRPKPAYVMPEPNDDIAAFGWTLGKLRYPAEDSKPDDIWPGASVFEVPQNKELQNAYGFDITFIPTKFTQILLDNNQAVRAGAEKVRAAGYTKEALAAYKKTIIKAFEEDVVPAMLERFKAVAGHVAEFYAARLAHIDKFGIED